MNGIENHKKTNIFFIVERLYPRDSLAPSVGTVGPSLVQVHRMIYQLTKKQDVFLDGEKVDLSNITLWQRLKSITGGKITTKDSQDVKFAYVLDYAGSEFAAVPIQGLRLEGNTNYFYKKFTKEYKISTPKLLHYGSDTIKNITLHGRSNVSFFMDNGGRNAPTAAAKYNKNTGEISLIKSMHELSKSMQDIKNSGART
ncbi:hypothetical protein B7R74_19715 [Yersinia pseudotuberculosis]|uniref:Uncharacterized protein n=1 Tax=Yersinia pseudotuberculosis TaxID=633 RepID=A0A380QDS9_YERPU|nr:hypothetical protein [Yersinia pseudotuberculosis]PSH13013.1 hypothetical protein B7R74_19715 [Yersinia pseudotuberculosis]SUP85911.1 Uncharacterised protein [Yersinia pseudotuberculosis]